MPELPEVEIVRRKLEPVLLKRSICAVRTGKPSYFFLTPPKTLEKKLMGRTALSLSRHGKYLTATLDDASQLLWHLGMTGQLLVVKGKQADPHVHLVLEFADGGPAIAFRDVRKFGKCRWLKPGAIDPRMKKLGIDALEITKAQLFEQVHTRKAPIKSVLLNQSVLAGVGNIYADEALFLSRIRPTTAARRLKRSQVEQLTANIHAILKQSIERGGSSFSDYLHPDGKKGGFQQSFLVYGREGAACSACGSTILRCLVGQRSTHYCPECQR